MMRASVAEWSKATDSSSVLFGGVGSNPTGSILSLCVSVAEWLRR